MLVLIITLTLSFLMVSTIKYRSFKDMKFRGGQHITYLVWGILALMLIAAWPQVMLFVIFAGYALLGPAERLVGLLFKMTGKRPSPKAAQSVIESK
jgi:CDP-diacylglycerol--serine O-phosphatidyltransferase